MAETRLPFPLGFLFGSGGGNARTSVAELRDEFIRRYHTNIVAPSTPAPPIAPSIPVPPDPIVVSPPPEPFAPQGPAPSGGVSDESLRQQAERAVRDTRARESAPPRPRVPGGARGGQIFEGEILRRTGAGAARTIGRAIFGPIGAAIWGIVEAGELGSGELTPEQRDEQESLGRDIARGGGIIAAGGVIGAGVVLEELGKLPGPLPLPPDDEEEPFDLKDFPVPSIPAPSIGQPAPLPLPSPIPTPLPMPSPARRTAPSSPPPRQAPRGASRPAAAPATSPWPAIASVLGNALQNRRSAWTLPKTAALNRLGDAIVTPPATSVSPISTSTPLAPSPTSPPLTGFQNAVLSSSPPRLRRTRSRTRECDCEPKPRRKARKCHASAPVIWAGGPKKGKVAGNRCYSFTGD